MNLTITTSGFIELNQKLTNLPLDKIGKSVLETTKVRYDKEVDPTLTPWEKNRPSTIRAWLRRGVGVKVGGTLITNKKVLIWNGILRESLTTDVSGNVVSIGTSVDYAKFHQFKSKKLPIREFLGFTNEDETNITAILNTHFS